MSMNCIKYMNIFILLKFKQAKFSLIENVVAFQSKQPNKMRLHSSLKLYLLRDYSVSEIETNR